MSRGGAFGTPQCIGFDEIERLLERTAKTQSDAFPPVNVEEPAEGRLRITLAVAGFAPERLSLTLTGREMTIKGERPPQDESRVFLHKGIAARGFQRSFILAEGLEIDSAQLANGLLKIELKRVPANQQILQIPITLA
ncbi:MAG: Hsp20 family protein [Alphaproteobacteria bacterium]|nr:Hsp20 family protein [Alphaproteobacteria bacterium]